MPISVEKQKSKQQGKKKQNTHRARPCFGKATEGRLQRQSKDRHLKLLPQEMLITHLLLSSAGGGKRTIRSSVVKCELL